MLAWWCFAEEWEFEKKNFNLIRKVSRFLSGGVGLFCLRLLH
jgi:hypothetical protein